jgi:endonuclease-3
MEDLKAKKKRAATILRRLKKAYPDADIALRFTTPAQLLCAVVLSAQTTDAHVNRVTEQLFKKYKSIADFAGADPKVFTGEVSSVNFFNNKAKNIIAACGIIASEYSGRIPDDIEVLVTLPGVGRKTSNILLWHIHHKAQGIVVDTHVRRVANNLGLTKHQDPVKIEKDLMELFSQKEWGMLGHYFQAYGRAAMPARLPVRRTQTGGKGKMEDCLAGLY